jgi:hypothetical protein
MPCLSHPDKGFVMYLPLFNVTETQTKQQE